MSTNPLESLQQTWAAQWPRALEIWSRFTKLSEPRWCFTAADEKREGLSESFAMIRLTDQAVVIGLRQILEQKLERFAAEVLAHEIGHHVYCPASLLDQGRMLARMRRALPTREHLAPLVANLYADLLINDRLQRSGGLDICGVYRALGGGAADRLWTFYMRVYEILWSLPRGSLATAVHTLPTVEKEMTVSGTKSKDGKPLKLKVGSAAQLEGDAQLGARLVRNYARDWMDGAGRFAALCLPYLLEDEGQGVRKILRGWLDTERSGH